MVTLGRIDCDLVGRLLGVVVEKILNETLKVALIRIIQEDLSVQAGLLEIIVEDSTLSS